jgi:DNA (cytosine-5)-methyltransferase 1
MRFTSDYSTAFNQLTIDTLGTECSTEPNMPPRERIPPPPYSVVSLFSGAMGLDLGLTQAGLHIAVSQDSDKWCTETIRTNGHVAVDGDIRQLIDQDPFCDFLLSAGGLNPDEVFAVVGGPPCQSFSTAGKRLGVEDDRGTLYEEFIHVVSALSPRFFIMENVKGLASMPSNPLDKESKPVLDVILEHFEDLGYSTVHGVVDAVHYGTPQFRERLVIIGSRDWEPVFMPVPTHFHSHQNAEFRWKTLESAIKDIESEPGECSKFTDGISKHLEFVPEGGNWKSLPLDRVANAMGGAYLSGGGKVGFYRRLSYREPSPTLVTSPTQKATLLCHPRKLRPLSVKEYARIQRFPDDWQIEGSVAERYRQIGNAVPIPLGKALGQMLISVAEDSAEVRVKRLRGTSVHSTLSRSAES